MKLGSYLYCFGNGAFLFQPKLMIVKNIEVYVDNNLFHRYLFVPRTKFTESL